MRRHALSIGVGSYGSEESELPFAAELAVELAASLEGLGYKSEVYTGPELPTSALGGLVRAQLTGAVSGSVSVVHVISHGNIEERTGSLWIPGSDGLIGSGETEVEAWLRTVERGADGGLVLFLLDLCQSGAAARLPWQIPLSDGRARAWVLAACESDRAAFDGRFSQAVINVIAKIRRNDLDIDPALSHIPYETVARAVRREVNRLADAADADRQQVTGTLIDSTTDLSGLLFFPNPGHDPQDRGRRLRAQVDAGVRPFLADLDEALDARHFIERASGGGPLRGSGEFSAPAGCFTGRRRELRQLSWLLSGESQETGFVGSLGVVTGSPGVGKSALLGVMVCAYHQRLNEWTRGVWEHVDRVLFTVQTPFAAVHARGRKLEEIVASFSRQLGSPPYDFLDDLVDHIVALPEPPALILDALDEAENGPLVMDELVLQLARARREDGAPAARIVVGVRKYGDYAPLREFAEEHGYLADLDAQSREVLEDELEEYVTELLKASDAYMERATVRRAFARAVAGKLVLSPEPGVRNRWGEFLVAGLYTRHFVATTRDAPIDDPAAARRVGVRAPRSLPETLNLDLSHDMPSLLSPVLSALARAYGDGMPLSVLHRVCGTYLPQGSPRPETAQLREALDAGRFYLRQSTDEDGTALYRIFHQSLADHLLGRGRGPEFRESERVQVSEFLDRLVEPLLPPVSGESRALDWSSAEPYVRRYLWQHTAEARRLDEFIEASAWKPALEEPVWTDGTAAPPARYPPMVGDGHSFPPMDRALTMRSPLPRRPDHTRSDRLTGQPNTSPPAVRPDRLDEIYAAEAWRPEPGLVLGGRWRLTGPGAQDDQAGSSTLWEADPVEGGSAGVLVKLVPTGGGGSSTDRGVQRRRGLRNEMRMRLSHPRIREVIDAGEDQGFSYVAMPFYRPGSLVEVFSQAAAGRMLSTCLDLCDQVLEGLVAAHSAGLVHLDIKPGNIVLDGDRVRIIDWGLSARHPAEEPWRRLVDGGTPFFAGPEQMLQRPGWRTPLADLHGVGALLYWLVAGRAPLRDELGEYRGEQHFKRFLDSGGRARELHLLLPGVPRSLGKLVGDWLHPVPQLRIPSWAMPERAAELARTQLRVVRAEVERLPGIRLGPASETSDDHTRFLPT